MANKNEKRKKIAHRLESLSPSSSGAHDDKFCIEMIVLWMLGHEHNYRCLVHSIKNEEYHSGAHTNTSLREEPKICTFVCQKCVGGDGIGIEWNYSRWQWQIHCCFFSGHMPMCSIIMSIFWQRHRFSGNWNRKQFYSNDIILIYFAYNSRCGMRHTAVAEICFFAYICKFDIGTVNIWFRKWNVLNI